MVEARPQLGRPLGCKTADNGLKYIIFPSFIFGENSTFGKWYGVLKPPNPSVVSICAAEPPAAHSSSGNAVIHIIRTARAARPLGQIPSKLWRASAASSGAWRRVRRQQQTFSWSWCIADGSFGFVHRWHCFQIVAGFCGFFGRLAAGAVTATDPLAGMIRTISPVAAWTL